MISTGSSGTTTGPKFYKIGIASRCAFSPRKDLRKTNPYRKRPSKGWQIFPSWYMLMNVEELLTYEIECRSRGGKRDGKCSYRRDLILTLLCSDASRVIFLPLLHSISALSAEPWECEPLVHLISGTSHHRWRGGPRIFAGKKK